MHQRMRLQDVKQVYRLIADLRERALRSADWRQAMLIGLMLLTGTVGGRAGWIRPANGRRLDQTAFQEVALAGCYDEVPDSGTDGFGFARSLIRPGNKPFTRLVDGHEIANSSRHPPTFRALYSQFPLPHTDALHVIWLRRSSSDDPDAAPSLRHRNLLHLFHTEIGMLWARDQSPPAPVGTKALPNRLQQTLSALMEGAGEKQVAMSLGLSPHTVHRYITSLYRRFGVCSRGELLAKCLKRPASPFEPAIVEASENDSANS